MKRCPPMPTKTPVNHMTRAQAIREKTSLTRYAHYIRQADTALRAAIARRLDLLTTHHNL